MRGLHDIARAINADLDGLIRPVQNALRHTLKAMPYVDPGRGLNHLAEVELELRAVLEKLTGSRHLPEEKAMVTEARRALLEAERRQPPTEDASLAGWIVACATCGGDVEYLPSIGRDGLGPRWSHRSLPPEGVPEHTARPRA